MKLTRGMNVGVSLIFLLGVISSCWAELRLLVSIFNHGDRYPIRDARMKSIYPLYPWNNLDFDLNADGGLTSRGKYRAFHLGQVLRDRYKDFLGDVYSSSLFEFHSISLERTLVTALLVAAGLFPPSPSQRWTQELDWQPIPIVTNYDEENILYNGPFCSKYLEILNRTESKDSKMIAYYRKMQNFYESVSTNTGAPVNNRVLYRIFMEHLAEKSSGLYPSPWNTGDYPEEALKNATIKEYMYSSRTTELQRYTGGVWLKKLLEHVDDYIRQHKKNDDRAKKAYFYSGHDANIAGIMMALGIYYPHVPDYASAINFELHQDDGEFYLKVLYKDSYEFKEYVILACCNNFCPLEIFKDIFKPIIPSGKNLECGTVQF